MAFSITQDWFQLIAKAPSVAGTLVTFNNPLLHGLDLLIVPESCLWSVAFSPLFFMDDTQCKGGTSL